jgi:hypothetical protein
MSVVLPLVGMAVLPLVGMAVLPLVMLVVPAPVSSLSSSAGQAVRLRPIKTAPAVRTTAPRSLRRTPPHCGHVDSDART